MPILAENCYSERDSAGNVLKNAIQVDYAQNRIVGNVVMIITIVFA
jgi:hypothetical protein